MAQVIAAKQNVTDGNGLDDHEPPFWLITGPADVGVRAAPELTFCSDRADGYSGRPDLGGRFLVAGPR